MGLALGGVGYSALATFVTLFYLSRHWNGAALCLTAFGTAFIIARLIFIRTIGTFGGFPVAKVCLIVESIGVLLLWRSGSPWMALFGAALTGVGYSLVFPALGVEAVERVPVENRGTALSVYTVFADVSFFMVGPVAEPSSAPLATPVFFSSRWYACWQPSASSWSSRAKRHRMPSLLRAKMFCP